MESRDIASECGTLLERMFYDHRARPVKPMQYRSIREVSLRICSTQHDRDLNAARNILKHTTDGIAGSHADGVHVQPVRSRAKAGTKKSKANVFRSW